MIKNNKSLFILIILSLSLTFFFFGNIIKDANSYYFVQYGDGIQTYHEYLYHINYDESLIYSKSMQYPYGENGYFSVNPLWLANAVKLIDYIIPIKEYALGIFNLFVIFSILIAAIFIYLIFKKLRIKDEFSIVFSIIIAFMSPQIARFGGHNSLGYIFAIPAVLYFMMSTWEKQSYLKSILIGTFVFFISGNHLYYLGFFALIITLYYVLQYLLFFKNQEISITKRIPYYLFELIIPFIITQYLIHNIHPVLDRTTYPWSFYHGLGSISGLIYPTNEYYAHYFDFFIDKNDIIWEAKGYIGILAIFFSIVLLVKIAYNIIQLNFKEIIEITDNRNLVIFLIIGIFGLILGIGFPFTTEWGHSLFYKIGYIKQFRAVARFTWIFYYSINIISIYLLYKWYENYRFKWLKISILILVISIYGFDIYLANKDYKTNFANRISILEDRENKSDENKFIKNLKIENFQAIIGVPFFHLGSENLYMSDNQGMRNAMIYSLKTGLPTLDVHSNRTPIQETYNTAQMIFEPYRVYNDFQRFKSKKSFLIIVDRGKSKTLYEERLIRNSNFIDSTKEVLFYELPFSYYENAQNLYKKEIENVISNGKAEMLTDNNSYFNNFDSNNPGTGYLSNGAMVHPCQYYLTIFDSKVPVKNDLNLTVSFWVGNIHTDVILRGYFIIQLKDKHGRIYEQREMNLGKRVQLIDEDWALIEDTIKVNSSDDILKITLINSEIKDKYNIVDNLLIRPTTKNIYFKNNYYFFNNRFLQ